MIAEFVGIKYDITNKNGVNCWGLIALVYSKILGKSVKDYPVKSIRESAKAFTMAFFKGDHGFKVVEMPNNLDVVTLQKGNIFHCGIWYNGRILHASNHAGQVVYQKFSDVKRDFETVKFWQI